jgi:hypothetical protein
MKSKEYVHISTIKRGDTVIYEGKDHTVGKQDIKRSVDGDYTLFGDGYKAGSVLVARIIFKCTG